MAIHKSQMTERQLEANMMFFNFWRARKRAREEGRPVKDDRQTLHAQMHMAHKPYEKL